MKCAATVYNWLDHKIQKINFLPSKTCVSYTFRKEVRDAMKQKQFIVTVDYHGEIDLMWSDIENLLIDGRYAKGNERYLQDIATADVKDYDNQEV